MLTDEELEMLSENIEHVSFDKGETIFREGVLNAHIFYLKKGLVKLHQLVGENKDVILKVNYPNCYFGLATVFGDRINRYSATAIEPTEVCVIDISTFKELILQNGKFAMEIISDVCKDELNVHKRYIELTLKQTIGRLAGALLFFSRTVYQATTFDLPLSRIELAEYLGISREGVTRGLAQFKEDGLINLDKNQITILKEERLDMLSEAG